MKKKLMSKYLKNQTKIPVNIGYEKSLTVVDYFLSSGIKKGDELYLIAKKD